MNKKSVIVSPCKLKGEIRVPTSKSYGHRALICAAFCREQVLIKEISLSQDIEATLNCLRELGADFKIRKNISSENVDVLIDGSNFLKEGNELFCNESGSTLRFMIPIASMIDRKIKLIGEESLMSRPMKIYENIYNNQNLFYKVEKSTITIKGLLRHGEYKIPGNISSQFITGLLFILPLLEEDSKIIITTELQSEGYVDMTIDIMKQFGIVVKKINSREYLIKGNQKYTAKNINYTYEVEGDFSQAAFWLVAGVLNGDLNIIGLNHDSIQGDKIIVDIINIFNGYIDKIPNGYNVKKSDLKCNSIDVREYPDLVPILSLLMSRSKGSGEIVGAERVRLKESDRLSAIREGLNNLGANIIENKDELIIDGDIAIHSGIVNSFNDHRIEMTLAIAATMSNNPVTIENALSIKKSYPKFYSDFKELGAIFKILD